MPNLPYLFSIFPFELCNVNDAIINAVSVNITAEPLLAYNLTVEGFHTYFVAANEDASPVWVHNVCAVSFDDITLPNGRNRDIELSQSKLDHVLHGQDGPNGPTGGHSTNSGSVQIVGDVEIGHGGVRVAQVEINGVLKSNNGGNSSLFPAGWTDSRIIREFEDALQNQNFILNPRNGNPRVRTQSGVVIEFIRAGGGLEASTLYPILILQYHRKVIMRDVSDKDWEEILVYKSTYPMLECVIDGLSPNLQFGFIAKLYKKYRLGDWNCIIPNPNSIDDKTYIYEDVIYNSCLFHQRHPKFGKHILECGHAYAKNAFVFFDYSTLEPAFAALNADEQLPYIPIYHAHPSDRYEYSLGVPLWED